MQNSELLKKNKNLIYSTIHPMPENNTSIQIAQHKVKTFAYQSLKSFHRSFKSFLETYRTKQELRDLAKIWGLLAVFLLFWGIFMYYINFSTTRGYFMKLANQELYSAKAKSDILKLEVLREKRENRDNLYTPKNSDLSKKPIIIIIPEESK